MLAASISAAERIEANTYNDADAALFMVIARPAMEELLQWRRRAELARDILTGENVLMFPGARG
jgi:hypothetical protein